MAELYAVEADGSEKPQTKNTNEAYRVTRLIGAIVGIVSAPTKLEALKGWLVKHQCFEENRNVQKIRETFT